MHIDYGREFQYWYPGVPYVPSGTCTVYTLNSDKLGWLVPAVGRVHEWDQWAAAVPTGDGDTVLTEQQLLLPSTARG